MAARKITPLKVDLCPYFFQRFFLKEFSIENVKISMCTVSRGVSRVSSGKMGQGSQDLLDIAVTP